MSEVRSPAPTEQRLVENAAEVHALFVEAYPTLISQHVMLDERGEVSQEVLSGIQATWRPFEERFFGLLKRQRDLAYQIGQYIPPEEGEGAKLSVGNTTFSFVTGREDAPFSRGATVYKSEVFQFSPTAGKIRLTMTSDKPFEDVISETDKPSIKSLDLLSSTYKSDGSPDQSYRIQVTGGLPSEASHETGDINKDGTREVLEFPLFPNYKK